MRKLASRCIAVALGAALVVGGQPAVAGAVEAKVDASRLTQFSHHDEDSVAGTQSNTLYTDILVNGARIMAPDNAPVTTKDERGARVTTAQYADSARGVQIERVVRTTDTEMTVEVTATNQGSEDAYFQLDLTNSINTNRTLTGSFDGERFTVGPDYGGYDTLVEFADPGFSGVANSFNATTATDEVGYVDPDGAQFQRGRWFRSVDPGDQLTAKATITFDTQDSAVDSDQDGLPDQWEQQGVTLDDGTQLPLNEWGADPHRPDVFLQLNWMESEYEKLGCLNTPDAEQCDTANTRTYRPPRHILDELAEKFDEHGVSLHIDAGETYSNIPNYDTRHGGQTEGYERYYFSNSIPGLRMVDNVNRLLGQRASVFHAGVIGDQMNPSNYSVGTSLVGDNGFYVAKHERMTEDSQLRNTIMHELGHNLGLNHNGSLKFEGKVPKSDYLPNYKSVMNYLYQFSYFDYSDVEAVSGGPLPEECNRSGVNCYRGDYRVPADWDNLLINSLRLGGHVGTAGVDARKVDTAALKKLDKEMERADASSDRVEVEVTDEGDLTSGKRGEVTLKLTNPGLDLHRYEVAVGGNTQRVVLGGVRSGKNTTTITVPVTPTEPGALPLDVRATDELGDTTFEDRFAVPVAEDPNADSTPMGGAVKSTPAVARVHNETTPTAKATPTTKAAPAPKATPKPESGSSSAAIVVPLLLLLAIAGGAAAAWASGLI